MANHVCPWWMGYLLINPVRRILSHPSRVIGPYVEPGMNVMDVGCAMGFFSVWMAQRVGDEGRVVCIDVQERMIRGLMRRATRANVAHRIDARVCASDNLGIDDLLGQIDFALAFHVAHEVPEIPSLLRQIYEAMKPGGKLLLAEPRGHVRRRKFNRTVAEACDVGFCRVDGPTFVRSWSALLRRAALDD